MHSKSHWRILLHVWAVGVFVGRHAHRLFLHLHRRSQKQRHLSHAHVCIGSYLLFCLVDIRYIIELLCVTKAYRNLQEATVVTEHCKQCVPSFFLVVVFVVSVNRK